MRVDLVQKNSMTTFVIYFTTAWLAQLEGHQTAEWEVVVLNPSRTNQGPKITGKIMLAMHLQTCLSSDDHNIGR